MSANQECPVTFAGGRGRSYLKHCPQRQVPTGPWASQVRGHRSQVVSPGLIPALQGTFLEELWQIGLMLEINLGDICGMWSCQGSYSFRTLLAPGPFPRHYLEREKCSGSWRKSALIMFRAISEWSLGCSGKMGWEIRAVWLAFLELEEKHIQNMGSLENVHNFNENTSL